MMMTWRQSRRRKKRNIKEQKGISESNDPDGPYKAACLAYLRLLLLLFEAKNSKVEASSTPSGNSRLEKVV